MINYYVDPGQGFIFIQNTSFLWAVILGLLGSLFFSFKLFFRYFKKFIWFFIIVLAVLIVGRIMMQKNESGKKVIILGIDAMDPVITEKLMREGKLPNFSYLEKMGAYSRLKTTMPSESIVAWTSFATGLKPGEHGIFDFVMRDPKNYMPYLALNEIYSVDNVVKVKSRRKGDAFWTILSKNSIPSFIYFCPNTFPPDKLLGRLVSGMGVPDITGVMGKYSFYTTKPLSEQDKDARGRVIHVDKDNNAINTYIYGPKISSGGSVTDSLIPLKAILHNNERAVSFELQGSEFSLKEGQWSSWRKVSFGNGLFGRKYGILKLYLKSVTPDFELYATPVNFNPQKPVFPISYPKGYSAKLASKAGLYYTQGMPYDTWALTEGRLDEKAFLEHADQILAENERILHEGLKEFKAGVFFFYFEILDALQHMFWRYTDPGHPLYEDNPLYRDVIIRYYEKMDRILGDVLRKIDPDTLLIVVSDHGFSSFRRAVNLNRWLLENGYLFLNDDLAQGREFFEDIDWAGTKAYALGFGGIYLNKSGREKYGILSESEAKKLTKKISGELLQLRDPKDGGLVIKDVYAQEDVFGGPYQDSAPDLFIGFNAGYRASWQTALGGVPPQLIDDNVKKWSGDHLIDPGLVPGVIFINQKVELSGPSIMDIAPTILGFFGADKHKKISGEVLLK